MYLFSLLTILSLSLKKGYDTQTRTHDTHTCSQVGKKWRESRLTLKVCLFRLRMRSLESWWNELIPLSKERERGDFFSCSSHLACFFRVKKSANWLTTTNGRQDDKKFLTSQHVCRKISVSVVLVVGHFSLLLSSHFKDSWTPAPHLTPLLFKNFQSRQFNLPSKRNQINKRFSSTTREGHVYHFSQTHVVLSLLLIQLKSPPPCLMKNQRTISKELAVFMITDKCAQEGKKKKSRYKIRKGNILPQSLISPVKVG